MSMIDLNNENNEMTKSVCRFWQSVSRQCGSKGQIHWMILFPKEKDKNKNSSCMLFNPEEKHKLYKTQDLGVEFAKSDCIATYGSWFLMQDFRYNLYIMNLFTGERIDLPSVESQLGMVKVERTIDDSFRIFINPGTRAATKGFNIRSPVFWIEEKTKDYIVIWGLAHWCVVYTKKGDTSWNQIRKTLYCFEMVYKDHKLYFLSYSRSCKIFDISGEISQQTFQLSDRHQPKYKSWYVTRKFVVTVRGDVLRVDRKKEKTSFWSFRVWKVYSSGLLKKDELQVQSLGDEAMLFDLGITVPANETDGLEKFHLF